MAAECLPPAVAQEKIEQAAYRAVSCLNAEKDLESGYKPFSIAPPILLAIDFVQSEMAEKAAIMPGAQREGRRVEYLSGDMPMALRAFRTLLSLAR
jgi:D-aminopeptidase